MIKPGYEQPIDRETFEATLDLFSKLMVTLHPFMPFVTEEIWHQLRPRSSGEDCMAQSWPLSSEWDRQLVADVEQAKDIISKVRDIRNQNQIKPRDPLAMFLQESTSVNVFLGRTGLSDLLAKLAVLSECAITTDEPANARSFISGTDKCYVVLNQEIDTDAEREKISKELEYQRGFIKSIEAKLSNERFVSGAPAQVVENERKKLADGLTRISILEESLGKLS
jgi:valyl-tRNA synthetase